MKPFATSKQYIARYGTVDESIPLDEILLDASRKVAAELDDAGVDWRDPSDEYAGRLMQVTRDMTYRAVSNSSSDSLIPIGASTFSIGANGFTESSGFGSNNPSASFGELYISRNERRLLGILGKMHVGTLSPASYRDRGGPHAWC